MTTRTADRVDEWDSRPFSDGYEELRTLADRSFSGAVTAGRATLYMLNGTVVGVLGGSIEDFEDATGTVYVAPTAALPLLAVMQERSDEVRAKYYSEETALGDADQKLSEGGFTGYVELSENVLSGDYYVVYHGGKSMSVAYVGESERLLTDEDAFEQADEEVGIYEVRPVEVEPIEIPEPEPPEDSATGSATTGASGGSDPESGADESDPETSADRSDPETDVNDAGAGGDSTETVTSTETTTDAEVESEPTERTDVDSSAREDEQSGGRTNRAAGPESKRTSEQQSASSSAEKRRSTQREGREPARENRGQTRESSTERTRDPPARGSEQSREGQPRTAQRDEPRHPSDSESDRSRRDDGSRQSQRSGPDQPRSDGPEGRERRSESEQPPERRQSRSVDSGTHSRESPRSQEPVTESRSHGDIPERESRERRSERTDVTDAATEVAERAISEETPSGGTADLEQRTIPSVDPDRTWTPEDDGEQSQSSTAKSTPQTQHETGGRRSAGSGRESGTSADLDAAEAEIADLKRRLDELKAERAELEGARDELTEVRDELEAERDELQEELERVRAERDELQAEIEDLRQQLAEQSTSTETTTAEISLSPAQAIDGTNLFVRYESKGDATLTSAHDGSADADAVDANLNLEYHTGFEADDAAVDGRPFEEFLFDTLHYRFVDWVVRTLLYEVRDTGHQNALADLYDALPRIDRAELNGSVSVSVTENGQEQRTQEHFDVVLRDRMGNPLVVTNLNDSREAATDEMMTTLVTAATRVGESNDHLAGAFFVTSSFFDPDALETAAEASGGGILSRDKRESFVRLSRKDGFHLCLVESRDGGFHLAVPEL